MIGGGIWCAGGVKGRSCCFPGGANLCVAIDRLGRGRSHIGNHSKIYGTENVKARSLLTYGFEGYEFFYTKE